jgi:hypothetical protein
MYFNNFEKIAYDINGDGVDDVIVNLTQLVKVAASMVANKAYFEDITIMEGERPDQLSYRLYGSTQYYWTFLMLNESIKNIWDDWPKTSTQLVEFSERKYEHLAATTHDDLVGKFIIGEDIIGANGGIATVKEIHVNNKFLVLEPKSGEFQETGESIYGLDSQDSIMSLQVRSKAHAPMWHIDSSGGNITAPRTAGTHPYTFFHWELMKNDKNRFIHAFKPEHVEEISQAIMSEMNS